MSIQSERVEKHKWPEEAYKSGVIRREHPVTHESFRCATCNADVNDIMDYGGDCEQAPRGSAKAAGLL
jgi:hypothetical protein